MALLVTAVSAAVHDSDAAVMRILAAVSAALTSTAPLCSITISVVVVEELTRHVPSLVTLSQPTLVARTPLHIRVARSATRMAKQMFMATRRRLRRTNEY